MFFFVFFLSQIAGALDKLSQGIPGDIGVLCDIVSILQEAPEYYPGSSKELKAVMPKYREMEGKIEDLSLFIQVTQDLLETGTSGRTHLDECKQDLRRWTEGAPLPFFPLSFFFLALLMATSVFPLFPCFPAQCWRKRRESGETLS